MASKVKAVVDDWTAVAQNTVGESSTVDFSTNSGGGLYLHAALDTTTAHTGTRFVFQVSSSASGDEDWNLLTEFVALIGTAATDLIEDNPLAAGSTAITLTGHALTALAKWLLIEDGTLVNSELIFEKASATNAITIVDGTTNAHAAGVAIFNVAIARYISVPIDVCRVRLLIDNTYDTDGSTLNYKLSSIKTVRV